MKPSGRPGHQEDDAIRHQAAKTFYEANHSTAVRRVLLAKSRPEHVQHQVGVYIYYLRISNDKLKPSRWRGPAVVCMVEPRTKDGVQRPSWVAHGSSLVRVAPEHVRPEVGSERATRLETMPQTAVRQPLQQQLVQALQPVRGPDRFLNLANQTADPDLLPSAPDPSADDSPDQPPQQRRRRHQSQVQPSLSPQLQLPSQQPSTLSTPTAAAEYTAPMAAEVEETPEPGVAVEKQEETMDVEKEVDELFEEIDKYKSNEDRERSRGPREKEHERKTGDLALRRLDGRSVPQQQEEEKSDDVEVKEGDSDQELLAEEFNEKKLTADEKKQFDAAKDKALMVWIDNQAWKAAPMEQVRDGEMVPQDVSVHAS